MASTLTLLDVGHGNCSVIESIEHVVLIDAGPGASVLEYLLEQEISHIDSVIVSHADTDHIRGLIALLGAEEFTVGEIFLNSDAEKDSDLWTSLAFEIDDQCRRGRLEFTPHLRRGDVVGPEIPGLKLQIVAPRNALAMKGPGSKDDQGRRITTNTMSAVVRVSYEGHGVALLAGDLDELGLEHCLETTDDISADVLVFPHHGGLPGQDSRMAGDFAQRLTQAVQPSTVAISFGRGRFSNPRPEVVAGIMAADASIRISCTQLSKSCAASLPSVEPDHLLDLYAAGRTRRACCAGTMRVEFNTSEQAEVMPNSIEHNIFITAISGQNALCRMKPN